MTNKRQTGQTLRPVPSEGCSFRDIGSGAVSIAIAAWTVKSFSSRVRHPKRCLLPPPGGSCAAF